MPKCCAYEKEKIRTIKQAGTVLASNGVKLVDNNVREEELGSINPTPLAVTQTRKTGMGGVGQ